LKKKEREIIKNGREGEGERRREKGKGQKKRVGDTKTKEVWY
jgi:hypothetical protein